MNSDQRSFSSLEISILRYIALGYQSKEIAAMVQRSKPTIEGYVRVLCAKLGARSRAHLVMCAIKSGVIALDDEVSA